MDSEIKIQSDILFEAWEMPVTNAMLAGIMLTLFILLLVPLLIRFINTDYKATPGTFQGVMEMTYEAFLDFVAKIAGSEAVAKKILPIIGTVFIYIGISNILTFLPLDGFSYTLEDGTEVGLFRTHTSDINATFGIAAAMIIWTQVYSILKHNIFRHVNKYFRIANLVQGFRKGPLDGFLAIIDMFVGILDIISEFAKVISLSLRLFGNMLAGLILGGLLLSLIAVFAPIPLILYGMFSGVLQALVFGALTSSYFGAALADE